MALDPNYILGWGTAGSVAVERGDFVRGAAAFEAMRRLSTGVEAVNALSGLALAEARAGRAAQARAVLRQAEAAAAGYRPAGLHTAAWMAQAYAALGEATQAVNWLRRYDPAEDLHFQLHLRCDPPFDPLASDPRFRSLLGSVPRGRGC